MNCLQSSAHATKSSWGSVYCSDWHRLSWQVWETVRVPSWVLHFLDEEGRACLTQSYSGSCQHWSGVRSMLHVWLQTLHMCCWCQYCLFLKLYCGTADAYKCIYLTCMLGASGHMPASLVHRLQPWPSPPKCPGVLWWWLWCMPVCVMQMLMCMYMCILKSYACACMFACAHVYLYMFKLYVHEYTSVCNEHRT